MNHHNYSEKIISFAPENHRGRQFRPRKKEIMQSSTPYNYRLPSAKGDRLQGKLGAGNVIRQADKG